eukprot:200029-Lingulodinium_polyedra.AAC.1
MAVDMRQHGWEAFIADFSTAFLNARIRDGEALYGRPPPEWQPAVLDPSRGAVVWRVWRALYGLRSSPRRWQQHLAT